ncbi:MAG: TIGR00303 family protein [Chloroflexaceae bacterium]|nr:TIGR00303 family protein [Chloroflexaceae bacterium]
MIKVHTEAALAQSWLERYRGKQPLLAIILGFTDTCLIPGISAAGASPEHRRYTAIADAEFLLNGPEVPPRYALPPLTAGASPVFISRTVIEALKLPVYLFDAGLPVKPAVPALDLGGAPARCLSTGQSLPLVTVQHLWQQGWQWGETLAARAQGSYLAIGECVVGGTTTALGLLTGLGIPAQGKVNSSHAHCNHSQKALLVQSGLQKAGINPASPPSDPMEVVAAVGDPMQVVAAAMALSASQYGGVLLAGGTQMLAVVALMLALQDFLEIPGNRAQIVVGTTRWVAGDRTGDTVGLARLVGKIPLMAAQLNFSKSRYPQLQAYEQGFVKEGVGAGGCAIAAHLKAGWSNEDLVKGIEALAARFARLS